MKYVVIVDGQRYEVELGRLHTQPIIALVNGEPVEVWLESENEVKPYFALTQAERPSPVPGSELQTQTPAQAECAQTETAGAAGNTLRSPLPGVVVSIAVQAGDRVKPGQELCVIEAMKMKNTLRAGRAGKVAAVKVIPGQSVQHHDVLVEFEAPDDGN